ncbi:MAG TPA: HAD family hydrolase [Terriglobales bacterium]|nr:HAD family hydrolase [Terriglobales bacterium]
MPSLETIFFDVGNTLCFPNHERILKPLRDRQLSVTSEQWSALERKTKLEFDDVIEHGLRLDHGFWYMFYTHLLGDLKVADDALRDELVAATRDSSNWDVVRPGTCDVLERIGNRYRIAVISNADGKIEQLLQRCGIARCFLSITDSGIVGKEKPDPIIFHAALEAMNADPAKSLYVGDVCSVDYLGATRAGMQAVLFDVAGAYRDNGFPRVESLEELENRLNGRS